MKEREVKRAKDDKVNGQEGKGEMGVPRLDLGAAQSSIFGSARNFFGSLSRLEPKITAQQQSCTQS